MSDIFDVLVPGGDGGNKLPITDLMRDAFTDAMGLERRFRVLASAGATRDLVAGDRNALVACSHATAHSIRVLEGVYDAGFVAAVLNDGSGDLSVTAEAGVTLLGDTLLVVGDARSLVRVSENVFRVI